MVLVGGGACNPGLVRAFRQLVGPGAGELVAPEEPRFLGALGAALMAAGAPAIDGWRLLQHRTEASCHPEPDLAGHRGPSRREPGAPARTGGARLAPLRRSPDEVDLHPPEEPAPAAGAVRAYLGLDVGSVSTNLVLLGPDLTLQHGVYLPTRGRPVDVLQEGLDRVRRRFGARLEILGVGSTGSGRHLAAQLVGADLVRNEITAQLTAALAVDPAVDTIFEIGGQDSKYISVRDGRLADFEMNKICAGGTGSFLEEQADRLGIAIVGQFADLALAATDPCDLGARCTVFMDTELVRALQRGVSLPDICAGLAYSVARNYLEKVVAGRAVGRAILFQGGTASNAAVVQAFRQILGRPVRVHPYNRLSGAIGVALLAARAGLRRTAFRGFDACVGSRLRSFGCRRCENRCQVNRVQIGSRAVHFGDVCERYAQRDRETAPAARAFGELFARRDALLERFVAAGAAAAGDRRDASRESPSGPSAPRIGLPRASLNLEFLPFWSAFLRDLGYDPLVSGATTSARLQDHARGVPAEVCLPIKTAAAHAHALLANGAVDRIFVPALLECPPREGDDETHTCLYSQQLPDMLRVELGERVISAQFSLGHGLLSLVGPTLALAQALDRSVDAVLRALRKANAAQARYILERRRLGQDALAASFDRAAVVLGRPYNTHDQFLNLSLAHHLERLGLAAIPWDLLPLDRVQLDPRWSTVPWYYSREQLRAIELVRQDPRLFPILISSYGCGPDGFIVKHMEELLADRPRLLLEFDEHRGEAGLVTRLEAFADEIDEHRRRAESRGAPTLTPGPRLPAGRRFFVPRFAPHADIYAAVLAAAGHAAEVLPGPDEATVRLGEQHASGRECHPYAIIAGELARFLETATPRPGDVFLVPCCTTPCLLRQYGDAYRLLLERRGSSGLEVWDADLAQLSQVVGVSGLLQLYEGLLATDILMVLGTRLRPYQRQPGTFDPFLAWGFRHVAGAVAAGEPVDTALAESVRGLWALARTAAPATRPVVGVTGDIYTRINAVGNAGLFDRLEQMGIEVWPSPYFASMFDLSAALEMPHCAEKGLVKAAAADYLTGALAGRIGRRLVQHLPPRVVDLAVEPPAGDLIQLARRYVGPRTNHLVLLIAAKMVDFLRRGATGVINAAGLNCMVGTTAAALIPSVRADHDGAPIITLAYGGVEGPSQRIRLETFVEQVNARWRRRAA